MEKCFYNLKEENPLIHCISNYVTVNDLANIILSAGGSPIMADDIGEVEEITSLSKGLLINMGTLNKRSLDSMVAAGIAARSKPIPVIFDPVGIGASSFRREAGERILKEVRPNIIKGNLSEIDYILRGTYMDKGVDSSKDISQYNKEEKEDLKNKLMRLARDKDALIFVTGREDIIATSDKIQLVGGGHRLMTQVTGMGCMLGGLLVAYLGANNNEPFKASLMASRHMKMAGHLAGIRVEEEGLGTGSFKVYLMDYIHRLEYGGIL